ncbi:MAG: 3'-5' exonuclease [Bacteroidetes bacterium]|nr:MAG: 3'-5' exonuclease [Bacteroidota bacterium]RLD88530.1 MAG: 3'-5' exonuclease [Bacteroidota bacterium]
MELALKRPIAFFDLETTGLNVAKDRIVEISIYKINPNGTEEVKTWLLNPDYPISEEASSIHGYTNEDVANYPTFKRVAKDIRDFLENCDLAGFNSIKFDIPLLVEEFLRAEVDFDVRTRKLIDVQNIFMKMEQRTLKAAYRFYLDKDLKDAHSAAADAKATYEILKAQLDRYKDTEYTDFKGNTSKPVVNDMEELHKFSSHHRNADLMGQIIINDEGMEVINFGKHKGKTVEEIFAKEPSYYNWMMNADFPLYTKKLITTIKLRMGLNKK